MTDVTPDQSLEDTRVFRAVEEYLAAMQTGRRPDRAQFLACHADIANRLSGCLAALEAVEAAAPSALGTGAEEDAPPLAPGTVLGGFRVLRELGRGGMGVVYLAIDTQLHRPVALKVIRPGATADRFTRQRFVREAQANAALRHEHVVAVYQVGEDGGLPFLAMELLTGQTLEQRLGDGPMTVDEALRVARQTAEGLIVAHERGLIHRDIKPANIFLSIPDDPTVDGSDASVPSASFNSGARVTKVKILDFGLARTADGDSRLTQSGVRVGTPHYMSPEQAAGDAVDPRSDLFSLGCVLYRMLTGRLPFAGDNLRATMRSVILDTPKSAAELRPDVPAALADLTMRLLAKNPEDRPQSASEVRDSLLAIEATDSEQGVRQTVSTVTGAKVASRKWPMVAAAGLALVLVAVSLFASGAFRGEPGPDIPEPAGTSGNGPGNGNPPIVPVKDAAEPFLVHSPGTTKGQAFASLPDAIKKATSGATIEIHGNGPFVYDRVSFSGKMLVLRAGPGFRPVLRQRADAKTDRLSDPFLWADRPLVLEGLEIQRFSSAPDGWQGCTVVAKDAPLYVTHCRFVNDTQEGSHVLNAHGWHCEVRNSLLLTRRNAGFGQVVSTKMSKAVFHNNLFFGTALPLRVNFPHEHTHDLVVAFSKNTLIGQGLDFALMTEPKSLAEGSGKPRVYLDATDNIIDPREASVSCVTCFSQHQSAPWNQPGARLMPTAEAEVYFRKSVVWKEQRNLYPSGVRFFGLFIGFSGPGGSESTLEVLHLANWDKFMGLASTGSMEGRILYQNEALPANPSPSLLALTPADFRLAAGSDGKGKDKDGNDLGANVDLVGPGPAYEAWKQTPAYLQWLKDTGQQK